MQIPKIWPLPPNAELQRKVRAEKRNDQGLQVIRDMLPNDKQFGQANAFSGGGDRSVSAGIWQPLDADLTAIAALADAAGTLTNDGAGNFSYVAALNPLYLVPSGGIIMWSGSIASIPSGWVLCDGSNSTPDLRNRFIVAADADVSGVAKTTVTGSATQSGGTISYTPAGSVSVGIANHNAGITSAASAGTQGSGATSNTLTQAAHTHVFTVSAHVINTQNFTGTAASIVPPFYALAYIMKT